MELFSAKIKKILIFSQKKAFLVFWEIERFKRELLELEKIKKNPPQKNLLSFEK